MLVLCAGLFLPNVFLEWADFNKHTFEKAFGPGKIKKSVCVPVDETGQDSREGKLLDEENSVWRNANMI